MPHEDKANQDKHGRLEKHVPSSRKSKHGKGVFQELVPRGARHAARVQNYVEQTTVPWLPWAVSRLCAMAPVSGEPSLIESLEQWLGRLYVPRRVRAVSRLTWAQKV